MARQVDSAMTMYLLTQELTIKRIAALEHPPYSSLIWSHVIFHVLKNKKICPLKDLIFNYLKEDILSSVMTVRKGFLGNYSQQCF
jgi:hypothetical protein